MDKNELYSIKQNGQAGVIITPAFLTKKELEILQLIVDGLSYRAVGYSLGISSRTVSQHMTNLRKKLGGGSTAQIVAIAVKTGIVKVGDYGR